jgi:hypothetical protein
MPGGLSRMFHFCRTMPFFRPRMIPLVIKDWIIGLSMRDYVDRHFIQDPDKESRLIYNYLAAIERVLKRYLHRGALEVSLNPVNNAASNLSISIKGLLDRYFFIQTTHYLEKILQDTTSSITLHIDEFHVTQIRHLKRLLKRLARYGDRICIALHENVIDIVDIDSSIFYLVFKTN